MTDKPESLIPYDTMVMESLRQVTRAAIQRVSDEGLPGEHHFYITFRTDHPMAELPEGIAAKYPTEIRIVLQNQFSNLFVDDFGFHVTLYFGGMPTPLYVPFDAITSFLDPHVQFSMRFEPKGMLGGVEEVPAPAAEGLPEEGEDLSKAGDNVVSFSAFRKS